MELFAINLDTNSTRSDTFGIVETTCIPTCALILFLTHFGDSQIFFFHLINPRMAENRLRCQMGEKRDLLIETDRATVMKDIYPKAQYHFLVVAKEDITNVTAVSAMQLL